MQHRHGIIKYLIGVGEVNYLRCVTRWPVYAQLPRARAALASYVPTSVTASKWSYGVNSSLLTERTARSGYDAGQQQAVATSSSRQQQAL
ncbi:hypothetical protein E2C01_017677 [Portunus trituberculatus]|uniref:Uncharacterized protein n=1 Tax=Portunus trituberculatus TaxID=210409 RepID=A0A5B7DSL3_PORTR|nr:hypothetical protein [Portunus trituberculatus]